ncbi:hypothetical protein LOC68_16125 [Blastopirellula sp. JC732]|uniref:Uncharacterized protein n=1 Tax=Blastopirellula sediminis TaxID=2894196 RepID=A0A9X1MNH7_9BACT|nr:hypothetical protein [Blastopirellula sediminis]MCC9606784.1 hypothetical protein [Blastopirellula sediminis]MCC9629919.1 hypothetical protein [Blastopirellula sediminis]
MTQRQIVIAATLCSLFVLVKFDQYQYAAHCTRRGKIVGELGGSIGSLMDWPFGREVFISFTHPLADDQLQRLSTINARGRDYVTVYFDCQVTDQQLQTARQVLSRCSVIASREKNADDAAEASDPTPPQQ